jgi:hypothetical protein
MRCQSIDKPKQILPPFTQYNNKVILINLVMHVQYGDMFFAEHSTKTKYPIREDNGNEKRTDWG